MELFFSYLISCLLLTWELGDFAIWFEMLALVPAVSSSFLIAVGSHKEILDRINVNRAVVNIIYGGKAMDGRRVVRQVLFVHRDVVCVLSS